MSRVSFSTYARLILALPGTAEEVAGRSGMTTTCTRRLLRQFWSLRLVHPGAVLAQGKTRTAIWLAGDGQVATGARVGKKLRPLIMHITFAHAWRGLDLGATVPDLSEQCGIYRSVLYRMLKTMRKQCAVHVCGWERDALGRYVAVWTLGEGKDARKPPPLPRDGTMRMKRTATNKAMSLLTADAWREAA